MWLVIHMKETGVLLVMTWRSNEGLPREVKGEAFEKGKWATSGSE